MRLYAYFLVSFYHILRSNLRFNKLIRLDVNRIKAFHIYKEPNIYAPNISYILLSYTYSVFNLFTSLS